MFPRESISDAANCDSANRDGVTELDSFSYRFMSLWGQRPYIADRIVGQLGGVACRSALAQAQFMRMLCILFRGHKFKIRDSVISFVPVPMIELFAFRCWAKEGGCNKMMHESGPTRSADCDANDQVAITLWTGLQDSPDARGAISCITSNPTDTRSGVESFTSRNWLPNFRIKFFGGKLLFSHLLSPFQKVIWLGPARCGNNVLACAIVT